VTEYANRIAALELVVHILATTLTEEQLVDAIGAIVLYAPMTQRDAAIKLLKG